MHARQAECEPQAVRQYEPTAQLVAEFIIPEAKPMDDQEQAAKSQELEQRGWSGCSPKLSSQACLTQVA